MILLSILALSQKSALPPFRPDEWNACEGQGKVAFWIVSATCNRLFIVPRRGTIRYYRLRQFEFQNGDHFYESGLDLDGNRLVVTHQHGMYEVDAQGKVVCEDSGQPSVLRTVKGRSVTLTHEADDFWGEGRTFQGALDWNGKRLLTREMGESSNTVSLFTKDLKFMSMVSFEGENVLTCNEWGKEGWQVQLEKEHDMDVQRFVWLSNQGKISFDHGVHWH